MNPDFKYIKQAYNPVAKKWEDVKEIEYKKLLVSKKDRADSRGGKGGRRGGRKGHRREMSPQVMQKMAQKTR